MKASQQHIIYFRDVKGGQLLTFGPFVSERLAEEFLEALPEPVSGFKQVWPVSLYDHNEAELARDEILRKRQH